MIPFIGEFKNLISQNFLQSTMKLLDINILSPDIFPVFKGSEKYGIKKSSESQNKVGIPTLTTFYFILSILSQGGIVFVGLVVGYSFIQEFFLKIFSFS
jgi:hypothetical protein